MTWNWQLKNWPEFAWDSAQMTRYEHSFTEGAGILVGASQHISREGQDMLLVELMCTDAVDSAEIEGEFLNRDSVQASVQKELGLRTEAPKATQAEQGMARMMVQVYQTNHAPLTHEALWGWHQLLGTEPKGLRPFEYPLSPGQYRQHEETMQIVSGPDYARKIHFEAPPSRVVHEEMQKFLAWFERTSPTGIAPLPALTRAAIAHLWFESIHPFEDGNGRIGRAIAEKALVQGFSKPVMTVLAKILLKKRKEYYQQLGAASKTLEITPWLLWFADMALEAQKNTRMQVDFVIQKATLFAKTQGLLNARQEKVMARLFRAGPEGFSGGLSAKNYMSITGAAIATTTRDLQDLVKKNILRRTGALKGTRYFLNLETI